MKQAAAAARNRVAGLLLRHGVRNEFTSPAGVALDHWQRAIAGAAPPTRGRIGIVALRNRQWVEWAVFCAHHVRLMGYEPVLIHSSAEQARIYGGANRPGQDADFWTRVAQSDGLTLVDIDRAAASLDGYASFAGENAETLAAYDLRIEENEGDALGEEYRAAYRRARSLLVESGPRVEHVLRSSGLRRVICPSGLIGWSVAVREAARRAGVAAVFVEAWAMRPGHMIWNVNQPALDYDIPGWMAVSGGWDAVKEQDCRDFGAFQERLPVSRDGWLDDFHPVQRAGRDAPLPGRVARFLERPGRTFLLGANVIGDSSTLRRATIFPSQRAWITHVIEFFRSRSDLNLIVRAHPDEMWQRARQRIGDIAAAAADGSGNILVLGGEQDVNTYALMDRCDAGLAWVSNVGVDMTIRGKPVLVAAAAQYAPLGICRSAASRDDYLAHLAALAAGDVAAPGTAAIERAKLYQWILFKRMSLQASGKRYLVTEYRLDAEPERDRFFRILAGELTDKGEPISA